MPNWSIEFQSRAHKDLRRLGSVERRRVLKYLHGRLSELEHPRMLGKPLAGESSGLWRYRIGDVRIICRIGNERLVVLVVKLDMRGEIYR